MAELVVSVLSSTGDTGTVITLADLVNRVHRMVNGSRRQTFNVLASDIDASTTSVSFARPPAGITVGSYLCIGSELMYVLDVNAMTVTVIRGALGTALAPHLAGALIEVDWRWFSADVLDALVDDMRSWTPDLFAVGQVDVTLGASGNAVDLPVTRYLYVLSIKRTRSGNSHWITEPSNQYRVDTGLPASSFPSGNALYYPSSLAGPGSVRVTYAQDFNLDTPDLSTTLSSIPLSNSLIDAAVYGASARLLMGIEAQRSSTESQPEPRQAADVHEGSALSTGMRYQAFRDKRLAEEARSLRSLYPIKFG